VRAATTSSPVTTPAANKRAHPSQEPGGTSSIPAACPIVPDDESGGRVACALCRGDHRRCSGSRHQLVVGCQAHVVSLAFMVQRPGHFVTREVPLAAPPPPDRPVAVPDRTSTGGGKTAHPSVCLKGAPASGLQFHRGVEFKGISLGRALGGPLANSRRSARTPPKTRPVRDCQPPRA
jgi:hypothetical protein